MNHLVYWIWLALHCGAGSELGSYLLKHFSTPKAVYEASEEELFALDGITKEIVNALKDRDLTYAEKIAEYCERVNVGILTLDSPNYPVRLRSIYAKPILLYYRGKLPNVDDNVLIACVGTRKCSPAGAQNAYKLGMELVHGGAIVVSGMASGIDSAAQKGAVSAGGHTIAVLGCGIDRVYPPENKELMEKIAATGTILTEYAPGTDPFGRNFPIRNRIISGLCQGTVVVEADHASGSMITAKYALKQGRDIFAFPGKVNDPNYTGTNLLIQNGASLVTCARDILLDYEPLYPDKIMTDNISMEGYRRKLRREEQVRVLRSTDFPGMTGIRENLREVPKRESAKNSSVGTPPVPVKKVHEEKKKDQKETAVSKEIEIPKAQPLERDLSGLGEYERAVISVMRDSMSVEEIAAELTKKIGDSFDTGGLLGALTMLELEAYIESLPGGIYRLVG
ncbi:MAG: DNA-processing protein DprA [Clostridia bacterium]|nr:DNA-processing protein DprA [Clostridia bacterium]